MILANGTRLHDRYLIDALVGQGGMGAVYRATDLHLGHTVAIKENLFPHDPSEDITEGSESSTSQSTGSRRSQFEREAQMLARLKHSGLPKVTDHFVIPDQGQYLVMEFVEGEDLSTRLKRNGPMGERDALNIANRVCDILSYLHTQKPPIIHRDLKPANIRLTPEGEVVVVDFGVAKLFTSEATVTAARAVTPGFSPLEQYGGSQSTDERSDIYALGATIHQLVVGKRPPEAPMRVTASVAAGQAWLEMPTVSPPLAQLLRKAMEMRPEERFQKIGEMAAAFRAVPIVDDPGDATRATTVMMPGASPGATPGAPTMPAGGATFAPPPAVPGAATTPIVNTGPGTVAPTVVSALPPMQAPPLQAPLMQAAPPAGPPPPPRMTAYEGTMPVSGAPPVEQKKKGNKTLVWVGVGVLLLLVVGGGAYTFLNGGGKPAATSVADNTEPVKPRDEPRQEPPAESVPGSNDQAAAPEIRREIPPEPVAQEPVKSEPARNEPARNEPAATPPPATKPPASNPPQQSKPPQQDNGNLVPLTDNPGKTPGTPSNSGTNTPPVSPPPAASTPAVTPPVVPPSTPAQTPPQTTPPAGSPPATGSAAQPAVIPPATTPTAPKVLGDTLFVDQTGGRPGAYATVADAVHAANEELDGRVRTLLIKPGTYRRATILFMGRSARLIGDGPPGSVVVEASGIGLSLEGSGILVRNIVVRAGSKVAVNVQGEARIEGCEFTSASGPAGVQVQGSANVVMTNCRITGSGERGILAVGGRAALNNCEISGNKIGVNVSGRSIVTMTGGTVQNNLRSGVRVSGGGTMTLTDVAVTNNMLDGVQAEGGAVTLKNCRIGQNHQFGVSCFGGGSRISIDGGDLTQNLRGAVEDSCGAVTKTGSIKEK